MADADRKPERNKMGRESSVRIMPGRGRLGHIAKGWLLLMAIAMVAGTAGCELFSAPGYEPEIWDWHDLNAMRYHLTGSFILMGNLDATTAGYRQLASDTAHAGRGWQPIGDIDDRFGGSFDGQGYQIRDLFVNRPDDSYVGLFGAVDNGGIIRDVWVVDATVIGDWSVGALVGANWGTVSNCYSSGSITGEDCVGGLVGGNAGGVRDSHSAASVIGRWDVGGLVGANDAGGAVSGSYAAGSVTGQWSVGGLLGGNWGGVLSSSYSSGSVSGEDYVGGLVGDNQGFVKNAYAIGRVTGQWHVGGLVGYNEGSVDNCYSAGTVDGSVWVGGLVGSSLDGYVGNSFWDKKASGVEESDGGMGRTTGDMQALAAFVEAGWDIIAVPSGQPDDTCLWNIVDGQTYPFLNWESG